MYIHVFGRQTAKLRIEDIEKNQQQASDRPHLYRSVPCKLLGGKYASQYAKVRVSLMSQRRLLSFASVTTSANGELEKPLRDSFHLMPLGLKREDVLEGSLREVKAELACLHERNQVTQRNILQRSEAILAALNRTSPSHPGPPQAADTDCEWYFI